MIRTTHAVVLLFAICASALGGQEPHVQVPTAPPPLKIITRADRAQINEAKDAKARLKTTIELAETHLMNAENNTAQHDYDNAAAEAGMYWALVEDAFSFMKTIDRDNNKRRDLYKRLELALRAHGPRLNSMRRSTPVEYAVWLKELEDFARRGRTEALNSFYGNTVLRDNPEKPTEAKQGGKPRPDN
ncbi:MAG TPA: hypothetical protein VIF64_21165 [Pyrinomonadaceae bacterium]|jgi:hypothetical protein